MVDVSATWPHAGAMLETSILAAIRAVVGPAREIMLHEPEFRGNEAAYIHDCITSGWVSSVGSYVDRFERDLATFCGTRHAVVTVNGTAALHVALLLAGVQPGDEVLLPALTFIATANAVRYANAIPHFVDSEPATLGIDVPSLERHLRRIASAADGICRNRETGAVIRALVPVHTFGLAGDVEGLLALGARWGLTVVEDAAEALGSWHAGRHLGGFGAMGTLSFNGNKVVTTGGGGAILTDDDEVARRAKHMTTTARVRHRWEFEHDEVGYNYRMPNLNAALGCAQLERLPDMLARKRRLAERYMAAFTDVPGISFVAEQPGDCSNYWLNAILLQEPDKAARDRLLGVLNDVGLMARPVWTLMHKLPMYRDCPRAPLEGAEDLEARIVNIPSSPFLADL